MGVWYHRHYMEHSFSSYSQAIKKRLARAWSLDLRSLSLFRVALALVIIADLILRSRYLVEHYTDMGIFPRRAFFELWENNMTWTLHTASGQLWFQILIFALHGFLALWLLVGYRAKIAIIGIWILTVSLQNRNMSINSAADDLLRVIIFWSMFLPLDRYWSWDKNRYTLPSLKYILTLWTIGFVVQQVFLYWVTAYMKLWPEWYVTHSAVYEILSLQTFRLPFGLIVYSHPTIMKFLSGASMFAEFIGPLLLITPIFHTWARLAGIAAIIGLHMGIVTHMSVGIFPWISMTAMLAFLPSAFWDKIIQRWPPRADTTVYYDNHCGLCTRWIRILQNFWLLAKVKYIGLSEAPENIQKLSAKNDMWVVSRGKKNTLGYDAFAELTRASWIGRIFSWFLTLHLSKIIGRKVYRLISGTRKFCTLPKPIPPAPEYRGWKIVGGIICAISLYGAIAINLAVMNCGQNWWPFLRTWPLSGIGLAWERKARVFDDMTTGSNSGWIWPDFVAARRPMSCDVAKGKQFDVVAEYSLLRKFFTWHTNILQWWIFLPRIDQYWGMFAPDPGNVDFWFVIDGQLSPKNGRKAIIQRDLWKDYVYGEKSDGIVSFDKPDDLHTLTKSDRWRKYIYNLLGSYKNKEYTKYFAESLCKRYNTDQEKPYILEKFTIYSMSQIILPEYSRSPIRKKPIWQHCCFKKWCFETEKPKNSVK